MHTVAKGSLLALSLVLAVLCTAVPLPAADTAADRDAWPMYIEHGDRTPPEEDLELVDDLRAIRRAWKFKRHMGVGKGLYPGTLRKARQMGLEPFQGGASSPVVADGVVFVSYYKPDGKAPAKPEGWRTVSRPTEFLPDGFFSVTADDILVAVDAETGRLLWERVEKGKGLNRLSHKRSHWGVSPACADGRVFHLGSMGRLYATRIRDGKELWETPPDPRLEKVRAEHIKARKLCWDSADRSSLIVVDDVVIVPRGRLLAYDVKTGRKRWTTDETVLGHSYSSSYATPTLWRHEGRTYIIANTGTGTLRLIDPKDGKVLWTYSDLGPFMGTLSVTGDRVILNGGTRKGGEKEGLFAAYRLTLAGPERLWSLPDEAKYRHHWPPDSGPRQKVCIRGDLAYVPLSLKSPPKGMTRQRLIVADAETGRIHAEAPFTSDRQGARPLLLEDRILTIHDDAHGDPVSASWWTAGKDPRPLTDCTQFPHVAITAYCTPIVQPYRDGRLYFRALDGLVCYDFRKPEKGAAESLHLTIPGELSGPRGDLEIGLYTEGGRITRGGIRGSEFLHDIDVSRLNWSGKALAGEIGVALPRTRKTEWYGVQARVEAGGVLRGTASLAEKGFDEPLDLEGPVHTMKHQPAWQPPCDYVLVLEGASLGQDRTGRRLLLFVTTEAGQVTRLGAWADQTTKTRPVVYPRRLGLAGGTLSGEIAVRYRADRWTEPLVEHGLTAAATYTFEARLAEGDNRNVGRYTGRYGVAWSRAAAITGRAED